MSKPHMTEETRARRALQKRAENMVFEEIQRAIHHGMLEADLSYHQIMGILESIKMGYFMKAHEDDNE